MSLKSGLYVTATPIGTLADITARALDVLREADVIACEDTRVTRKLLNHYAITTPLIAVHDHNERAMVGKILNRIRAGAAVALVSDAGTPLISDPGYRLVREAQDAGLYVTTLPGPSAVMTALTLAGLATDRFFFNGFLPPKRAARRAVLEGVTAIPGSLVFFESARRLASSLADMVHVFGPREAAVCRELTKKFEEVRRGTLVDLCDAYDREATPKGEIVIVVGPATAESTDADDSAGLAVIDRLLAAHLNVMTLRDAVDAVVAETGAKKREVYARAVALKEQAAESADA